MKQPSSNKPVRVNQRPLHLIWCEVRNDPPSFTGSREQKIKERIHCTRQLTIHNSTANGAHPLLLPRPVFFTWRCCWLAEGGDDPRTTGEMRWGRVRWGGLRWGDEDDMSAPLTDASIFCSDIFKHLTEVKCVTSISKWRRRCSKKIINIQNAIRCPLKRFQSSKLREVRWSWSENVRWDGLEMRWVNGFEVRWVRCGLGGLPPVVVTSFGGRVQPPRRDGVSGYDLT